jgi:hypothetical protein
MVNAKAIIRPDALTGSNKTSGTEAEA